MIQHAFSNLQRAFNRVARGRSSAAVGSQSVREVSFLWVWFNWIFNTVDKERLKLVGPDCACAEWLLRNGASVKFKGHPSHLTDYNTLIAMEETPELPRLKVEEIFARDAGLSEPGFDHLRNCEHVRKITLIFCSHVNSTSLFKLKYVSKSLEHLEMRSCFAVDDEGVLSLTQLKNLRTLILADLVSVKQKDECEAALRRELSKCNVQFEK